MITKNIVQPINIAQIMPSVQRLLMIILASAMLISVLNLKTVEILNLTSNASYKFSRLVLMLKHPHIVQLLEPKRIVRILVNGQMEKHAIMLLIILLVQLYIKLKINVKHWLTVGVYSNLVVYVPLKLQIMLIQPS